MFSETTFWALLCVCEYCNVTGGNWQRKYICVITWRHLGSGGVTPLSLNLNTRRRSVVSLAPRTLKPQERSLVPTEVEMSPRGGLKAADKRKSLRTVLFWVIMQREAIRNYHYIRPFAAEAADYARQKVCCSLREWNRCSSVCSWSPNRCTDWAVQRCGKVDLIFIKKLPCVSNRCPF